MKNFQVLIVDDSALTRKMVEAALQKAPISLDVLEATNGADALTIIQRQPVDLVFTDIKMPGMDGLELLRALRSAPETKSIPVIMISAESSSSHVTDAVSQGAQGYLLKPFTLRDIVDHLTRLLEIDDAA